MDIQDQKPNSASTPKPGMSGMWVGLGLFGLLLLLVAVEMLKSKA